MLLLMSYIEKKYKDEIFSIFNELQDMESSIINRLKLKSLKEAEPIAKLCAMVNKKINLILKKFYPEINNINDKLEIKSNLKFYYDLLDKLTDFIRNVENFSKIDESYYELLIEFLETKNALINGKYKEISRKELTAFYDPTSRRELEKIVSQKFELKSREFFTIGPLETEIKKIARTAGATEIHIRLPNNTEKEQFKFANSVVFFKTYLGSEGEKGKVVTELTKFLESKKYKTQTVSNKIFTDAQLLMDKDLN